MISQADGPVSGGTSIGGSLSTADDIDYFVLYAEGRVQLRLTATDLTHPGADSCMDAGLFDTDGVGVPEDAATAPGVNRYFVRIQSFCVLALQRRDGVSVRGRAGFRLDEWAAARSRAVDHRRAERHAAAGGRGAAAAGQLRRRARARRGSGLVLLLGAGRNAPLRPVAHRARSRPLPVVCRALRQPDRSQQPRRGRFLGRGLRAHHPQPDRAGHVLRAGGCRIVRLHRRALAVPHRDAIGGHVDQPVRRARFLAVIVTTVAGSRAHPVRESRHAAPPRRALQRQGPRRPARRAWCDAASRCGAQARRRSSRPRARAPTARSPSAGAPA